MFSCKYTLWFRFKILLFFVFLYKAVCSCPALSRRQSLIKQLFRSARAASIYVSLLFLLVRIYMGGEKTFSTSHDLDQSSFVFVKTGSNTFVFPVETAASRAELHHKTFLWAFIINVWSSYHCVCVKHETLLSEGVAMGKNSNRREMQLLTLPILSASVCPAEVWIESCIDCFLPAERAAAQRTKWRTVR